MASDFTMPSYCDACAGWNPRMLGDCQHCGHPINDITRMFLSMDIETLSTPVFFTGWDRAADDSITDTFQFSKLTEIPSEMLLPDPYPTRTNLIEMKATVYRDFKKWLKGRPDD